MDKQCLQFFNKEYIEDLTFFKKIAAKSGILQGFLILKYRLKL